MHTLYLDNAATSYPKPPAVLSAVQYAMREGGGNPGRSGHRLARAAGQLVYDTRVAIASLFGDDAPEHVVFTHNATYAINLALKACLRAGDHVILSNLEHNAVLRPIVAMTQTGLCSYSTFSVPTDTPPDEAWEAAVLRSLAACVRPNTRAVVVTHTSNLCGITLPLQKIGDFCHAHRLLFFVDASQSAGCIEIDAPRMHVDALCFPAHKGLYGIGGCGAILFSRRLFEKSDTLQTRIEGGSGVHSRERTMPSFLPERLEAGTLPVIPIAALGAGIRFVSEVGVAQIGAHEASLAKDLKERLATLPSCTVYAPAHHTGVVLFNCEGITPQSLGAYLDEAEVCVREGLHCAPLAHEALGTGENGAVRVSFGAYNRPQDVDRFFSALKQGISTLAK